jgi:uncharacterized SAM-binding protein YcdF (DUF218 family)
VAPEQREGIEVNIDKPPEGLGSRPRPVAYARSDCIAFTRLDAGKWAARRRRRGHHTRATRLRRGFAIGLVLVILCAGAWIEREALLRAAADLWIVSDPITPADAVVVLGGGIDLRPFVAADLYTKGLVKKVLLSKVKEPPSVEIGAVTADIEDERNILLKLGVPDSAIETFGNANKNTREEATALKSWAERNAASVLIIPTEIFPARRVSWMFHRTFAGTGVRIAVPSFDPPRLYTRADWWKTEDGLISFQNEILKYLYYRWKY